MLYIKLFIEREKNTGQSAPECPFNSRLRLRQRQSVHWDSNWNTNVKLLPACRSASECSHLWTRPCSWPQSHENSWRYLTRFKSYHVDKESHKQTLLKTTHPRRCDTAPRVVINNSRRSHWADDTTGCHRVPCCGQFSSLYIHNWCYTTSLVKSHQDLFRCIVTILIIAPYKYSCLLTYLLTSKQ